MAQGNAFADTQAKLATQELYLAHLLPLVPDTLPLPQYFPEQFFLSHKPSYIQNTQGWIF